MSICTGTVVDNKDPLKMGRVRVKIQGVHPENADVESLPWADVVGSNEFGQVGGVGISSVLHQGTDVWVMFQGTNENEDKDHPVVIGTCHKKAETINGFGDPNKEFPPKENVGRSSYNSSLDGDEYTNATNIHTSSGHDIIISDIKGNERIEVKHKSGTHLWLKEDGSILIDAIKRIDIHAKDDIVVNSDTNISIQAPNGNCNISAKAVNIAGSETVKSNGPTTEIQGDTVKLSGSTTDIQGGSGDTVINGISLVNHTHPYAVHSGITNPPS